MQEGLGPRGCVELAGQYSSDWRLNPSIFSHLRARWSLRVDLFASVWNRQLGQFVTWGRQPDALAVDAFSLDWVEIGGYAFPQFFLIQRCLMKALRDRAQLTLVTPFWPAQTLFPLLTELACELALVLLEHKVHSRHCYELPNPMGCTNPGYCLAPPSLCFPTKNAKKCLTEKERLFFLTCVKTLTSERYTHTQYNFSYKHQIILFICTNYYITTLPREQFLLDPAGRYLSRYRNHSCWSHGDGTETSSGLSGRVVELLMGGSRNTTSTAYQSAWSNWSDWCVREETDPMSPSIAKVKFSFIAG